MSKRKQIWEAQDDCMRVIRAAFAKAHDMASEADAKARELRAKADSGTYSEAIMAEYRKTANQLENEARRIGEATRRDAEALIEEWKENSLREISMRPGDWDSSFGDLVRSGVKLTARDVETLVGEYADNPTMLRAVRAEADRQGVSIDATIWAGSLAGMPEQIEEASSNMRGLAGVAARSVRHADMDKIAFSSLDKAMGRGFSQPDAGAGA